MRLLVSLLLLMSSPLAAETFWVYLGTGDQDIYVSRFDPASGELGDPKVAAEVTRPNFLELHPSGETMYVCSRRPDPEGDATGLVLAYRIDKATGALKKLNEFPTNGPGPAHVNVTKDGRTVAVANYTGGSTASFRVADDGSLVGRAGWILHEGSSVNPRRQNEPHSHSVNFSPDDRFVISADLGTDQLLVYRVHPETSAITPHEPPFAKVEPGSGPRHFTFHPNGRWAYVINELLSTVTGFNWDAAQGVLTPFQTISTLPEGYEGTSTTAEVLVHPNGKFLYGSNRGHDSIAVFSIDQTTGKLTPVEREPSGGETPRNFRIDPTGRWLLAANQATGNVVVFRLDPETGKLEPTGRSIDVKAAMCVRFLPAD